GAVAVDELIFSEAYPPPDTKVHVERVEKHCGGLTAIALIAASRLGSRCAYDGVRGEDERSQFAMERMRSEGIDLSHLRVQAGARPVHSYIIVDTKRGTRNIFA